MLEALGVPTSRSFSLVETGENLERPDEPSPTRGAVLTRLSHSHVRFGTFQRHAYYESPELLRLLVDHVIDGYYPELTDAADRPADLLGAVAKASAHLVGRWMAAGFVHGVLNTDNMSVTGESFDYGPYRFLPRNNPNFVAAYFDQTGLYSFGRQPEAMFWNLQQLAGALSLIASQEALVATLNGFSRLYREALCASMLQRLGLTPRGFEVDFEIVNAAFRALSEGGEALRWEPFFFDWFCGRASEPRALNGPRAAVYGGEAFAAFRDAMKGWEPDRPNRLENEYFAQAEPEELLYDQIEAVWAPIADADDWAPFDAKLARIEAARRAWNFSSTAI